MENPRTVTVAVIMKVVVVVMAVDGLLLEQMKRTEEGQRQKTEEMALTEKNILTLKGVIIPKIDIEST